MAPNPHWTPMSTWKRLLVTIAVIAIRKDLSLKFVLSPRLSFLVCHVREKGDVGRMKSGVIWSPWWRVWPFPALSFLEKQLPRGGIWKWGILSGVDSQLPFTVCLSVNRLPNYPGASSISKRISNGSELILQHIHPWASTQPIVNTGSETFLPSALIFAGGCSFWCVFFSFICF